MKYRVTAVTPLLVGDGRKLSPIDYMVWKDQINVLDQTRIFRLLAKGPRLENYLTQIRKAERLDFASWGGFAQNFADRRIQFEHPSSTRHWESARVESLHIPMFCADHQGAYLPGSALKGVLRTGFAYTRFNPGVIREVANRMEGERPPRHPGESAELMTLGPAGTDPLKAISVGDSTPVTYSSFRVYLLRVSSLESKTPGKYELGWKQAGGRGSIPANRAEQATPIFAEMAAPGTVFSGDLHPVPAATNPEMAKAMRWGDVTNPETFITTANEHARTLLQMQRQYAEWTGLPRLIASTVDLERQLAALPSGTCLINMGWGGGFLAKAAYLDTANDEYRRALRRVPFFERAIRTGMPFPKTRRIVFLQDQPAAMPGWATLELAA